MKRENYLKLTTCIESYEHALECKWKDPAEPLYHDAVYCTHERLMEHIRYILWDEAPSDMPRPENPYDDFLVV